MVLVHLESYLVPAPRRSLVDFAGTCEALRPELPATLSMPRKPTNSLILTGLEPQLLTNPQEIAQLLAENSYHVELVSLSQFERIIITCASSTVATNLRTFLATNLDPKPKISYSLRDNPLSLLKNDLWAIAADSMEFLELPLEEGSRRFLILPPLSPQSEWDDFEKVEEGPNKKSIYSPQELSHLLWDRLGGLQSSQVRRYVEESENEGVSEDKDLPQFNISAQPEVLFERIDNGVPAIVIDKVRHGGSGGSKIPKTAIPPTF